MASTIEFNGKKYDSLTGKVLASVKDPSDQIDVKQVFKPAAKSIDGVSKTVKKIEIQGERDETKPAHAHKVPDRHGVERKRKVERPKTLMRHAVKKPKHKASEEHKAPVRVELYQELRRERARRAKHIPKSSAVLKFSKTEAKRKPDVTFKTEHLPVVAMPPVRQSLSEAVAAVTGPAHQLTERLEQAVQSAESHLEVLAEDKLKTRRSRRLAYAFASITSVFLIGFAVYQAIPVVQVKVASNKAGFDASLPGYAPSGYGLENNLETEKGAVTLTYSSETDKQYKITQTPSKWNSDSLLNSYVMPTSEKYERIDQNGQTVYTYNDNKSATWLDNGVWFRLDGAENFSDDQLLRIVQGL